MIENMCAMQIVQTGYFWGAGKDCKFTGPDKIQPPCPTSDQSAVDAREDGKAAVRFLRSLAADLRLDPERIGVAGDSAGAITSNWMGYVPGGEGHSGTPGVSR